MTRTCSCPSGAWKRTHGGSRLTTEGWNDSPSRRRTVTRASWSSGALRFMTKRQCVILVQKLSSSDIENEPYKAAEVVIAGHVDVVDRQVRAYNERSIDAFIACYGADVVVEDARGEVLIRGRDSLRDEYAPFFRDNPSLRGGIRHRTVVGDYVIDEEEITGWQEEPVQAVAIYHVAGGLIDHVRLIV